LPGSENAHRGAQKHENGCFALPSVFYLFGPFKNFLSGKHFEDQNALQKTNFKYQQ
jgi:hypothetical protein